MNKDILINESKKELEKAIEKKTLPLFTIRMIVESIKELQKNNSIIILYSEVANFFQKIGFNVIAIYKDPKYYNNYNIFDGYKISF